jgi:hypothetical protein
MKYVGLSNTILFLPSAGQTLHPELLPAKKFVLSYFVQIPVKILLRNFGFQNSSDANTTRILGENPSFLVTE